MIVEDKCGGCRFWIREDPTNFVSVKGFCRRYPPTVFLLNGPQPGQIVLQSQYPPASRDHWCGEYTARPVIQNQ